MFFRLQILHTSVIGLHSRVVEFAPSNARCNTPPRFESHQRWWKMKSDILLWFCMTWYELTWLQVLPGLWVSEIFYFSFVGGQHQTWTLRVDALCSVSSPSLTMPYQPTSGMIPCLLRLLSIKLIQLDCINQKCWFCVFWLKHWFATSVLLVSWQATQKLNFNNLIRSMIFDGWMCLFECLSLGIGFLKVHDLF